MHKTMFRGVMVSAVLLTAICGTAFAGSNNTITIEQKNTTPGIGNSLTVDQSLANDSSVGGATLDGDNKLTFSDTALQVGSGNSAKLVISNTATSSGGQIGLLQDNQHSPAGGNTATVQVDGGVGLVSQIGSSNLADLTVSGPLTKGSILQNGDRNIAGLTVTGENSSGSIVQDGSDNATILGVTGNGTSVNYTLNDSNVTNAAAGGVQVISNGATVTITQTRF